MVNRDVFLDHLFPHKENLMNFVGVDLHKKLIVACVMNQDRQVLQSRRFACRDTQGLQKWFASLGAFQVVVEATAAYEWFVQFVEPLAQRVVLAHPGKLRVIAESTQKTDKIDAKLLALFLALDMIPPAHRPSPRQREHRVLIRQRHYLRRRLTSVKNRLRNILASYNADLPNLFTVLGREQAKPVALSAADRFAFDQLWREHDLYAEQLHEVDRQMAAFAKDAPPAEAQARNCLKSIAGVGQVTTEVFLAEVGDLSRFRSQKKVVAYAGLAPGQRESAGKRRELGITHRGSGVLRWVLCQSAWQLVRRDRHYQDVFQALAKRRGKKKAITAIARRLLCLMVSLVNRGQSYCPPARPPRSDPPPAGRRKPAETAQPTGVGPRSAAAPV